MEPEGSLPCSQEPSAVCYPEPDQSMPYYPILSDYLGYILILSTHLSLSLPYIYTSAKYEYVPNNSIHRKLNG
jgi:hypothetical protein